MESVLTPVKIIALLDCPTVDDFGMGGFFYEYKNQICTCGVHTQTLYCGDTIRYLVKNKDAMEVDISTEIADNFTAGWIGIEFRRKNDYIPFAPPLISSESMTSVKGVGHVLFVEKILFYTEMDGWLRAAYTASIKNKSEELAELMMWTLPDRIETKAALWFTGSEEKKKRMLDWWSRLYCKTHQELLIEINSLLEI